MTPAPDAPVPKAPRWAWWVASGFGSGYLKPAPGTWGSAAAVIAWLLMRRGAAHLPGGDALTGGLWYGLLPAMGLTWLGIRASEAVVRETGEKDPSWIVVDEWAGQWLALTPLWLLVPFQSPPPFLELRALVPFGLFRLFDIWKPGLIHDLQDLPGGKGIVMDDVLAGAYAAVLTAVLLPLLARL